MRKQFTRFLFLKTGIPLTIYSSQNVYFAAQSKYRFNYMDFYYEFSPFIKKNYHVKSNGLNANPARL